MAKVFYIGHPLDVKQNRLELLEDDEVVCAIEDIEADESDDDDNEPMILIEDSEDGDGIALTQSDLQKIWPYLESFRKNGSIGVPKIDLDRADLISSSQQEGHPYIHVGFGSTQYEILIDETVSSCADVVKEALENAKKAEEHESSNKENLLTTSMSVGISTIQSTKAEKWKQLAQSIRNPTNPSESA